MHVLGTARVLAELAEGLLEPGSDEHLELLRLHLWLAREMEDDELYESTALELEESSELGECAVRIDRAQLSLDADLLEECLDWLRLQEGEAATRLAFLAARGLLITGLPDRDRDRVELAVRLLTGPLSESTRECLPVDLRLLSLLGETEDLPSLLSGGPRIALAELLAEFTDELAFEEFRPAVLRALEALRLEAVLAGGHPSP